MKRILVVNDYDSLYGKFWGYLGTVSRDVRKFLDDPQNFDLVCFTGGEDVSPELYGHKNLGSHNSLARDAREKEIFDLALRCCIPMSGICRGSQFLNVMCGGTMIQHLRKDHGGSQHGCETHDGQLFEVTSSHHQMIVPGEGGRVLAWAEESLPLDALVYGGDVRTPLQAHGCLFHHPLHEKSRVVEAIYYPKNKVAGFQFHAEWMNIESQAAKWQLRMTEKLCWDRGLEVSALT